MMKIQRLYCILTFYFVIICFGSSEQCNATQSSISLLCCDGGNLTVACEKNSIILVSSASYEPSDPFNSTCMTTKGLQTVQDRCERKQNCSIPVSHRTFRVTDRSCHNVRMCLNVRYRCKSDAVSPTSPYHLPVGLTSVWSQGLTTSVTPVSSQHGTCSSEQKGNVTWPQTPVGSDASEPCPNNPELKASWYCGKDQKWVGEPDFSHCFSPSVTALHTKLNAAKDTKDIMRVADELISISMHAGELYGGDLTHVATLMNQLVSRVSDLFRNATDEMELVVPRVAQAVVNTSCSLLNSDVDKVWHSVNSSLWPGIAVNIMSAVESSGFLLTEVSTQNAVVPLVTQNILLEAVVDDLKSDQISFPQSTSVSGVWEGLNNSAHLNTATLAKFAAHGQVKLVFTVFNNLDQWLQSNESNAEDNFTIFINTNIISAAVSSQAGNLTTHLDEPVVFTLQHKAEAVNHSVHCVFWNLFDNRSSAGHWSTDGCSVVSTNATYTTCECNHLTSFAVLMSPTGAQPSAVHDFVLTTVTYVGCVISIICLFLAFLTFQCFRNLACDRTTIHLNLVVCLMIANLIFIIGIIQYKTPILCSIVAALLHYFFLASFAWMCLEGFQLYVMLIEVFEPRRSRIIWYYVAAYVSPAVIVAVSAAIYHEGYGTEKYCWLSVENGFIWAFIGPVIVIILVNIVMLAIAVREMYRYTSTSPVWQAKDRSTLQQMRSWLQGAVTLIVLLGVTWAFGLAYVSEQTLTLAYIFTILNSLQGAFIFIFHCIMNDKVQLEYKRCIRHTSCFPESCRKRFGRAPPSYLTAHNQSPGSGENNKSPLMNPAKRKSSNSSSLSKSNSNVKTKSLSVHSPVTTPVGAEGSHALSVDSPVTTPLEAEGSHTLSVHSPVTTPVEEDYSHIENPLDYLEPINGPIESEIPDMREMSNFEGSMTNTDFVMGR